MTVTKRKYTKPVMQVYVLKQRASLLVGSVNACRSAYGNANQDSAFIRKSMGFCAVEGISHRWRSRTAPGMRPSLHKTVTRRVVRCQSSAASLTVSISAMEVTSYCKFM